MDAEEIARRVSSLKLSSRKNGEAIIIPADLASLRQSRLESCLVGKVFSPNVVNRNTFKSHMPRILQAKKLVRTEVIGENTFLLNFTSDIDRRHALSDGPWSFSKTWLFSMSRGESKNTLIWFLRKCLYGYNVIMSH